MGKKKTEPLFSFKMPKDEKIDSAKRMANEYNMICETYTTDCGEKYVGFWKIYNI